MDMIANMKAIGFTVVPIKTLKGNEKMQYVNLKKLDPRLGKADKTKPPNRTVFVGNIPPWATEDDLQLAFQRCGEIERVDLQPAESEEEKKRRLAYIIFSKSEGADRAVQLPSTSPLLIIPEGCPTGLARYWAMHLDSRKFDMGQMEKDIRQRIADYDRKEKEEEEAAKNPQPDEDGWVTVTRVGKNKGAPRTEAEDNRLKTKETVKRKRKEKPNFYSFQNRAMKRQRIEELRNKFQQDKSAIEKMKKERKFRPF